VVSKVVALYSFDVFLSPFSRIRPLVLNAASTTWLWCHYFCPSSLSFFLGDDQAFITVVHPYSHSLHRFIFHMIVTSDTEDW
jgi:hypothetical protein